MVDVAVYPGTRVYFLDVGAQGRYNEVEHAFYARSS